MTFGSYRLLSPFALFESYAGVILGNAASIIVVAIIQGFVFMGVQFCRRTRPVIEWMATSRFPSMVISVSLAFHTGTAFAASQIISTTENGGFELWEVIVGAVAFGYTVLLPIVLIVHPYLRIERAYQSYDLDQQQQEPESGGTKYSITKHNDVDGMVVTSSDANNTSSSSKGPQSWPSWVLAYCMPDGAVFSHSTRQAYGSYISSYRAPAPQVWWTSYPTWTACIIGIGGLAHPTTVLGCQALFAVMGMVLVVIAGVVVWRRPFRSIAGAVLDAISKLLLAGVLFCFVGSLSSPSPSSADAIQTAILVLGLTLMVFTLLRAIHACVCIYFDWRLLSSTSPSTSSDQQQGMLTLSLVWYHIPGESKKSTRTFTVAEDDSRLNDAASVRDSGVGVGGHDFISEDDDNAIELHHHHHDHATATRSTGDGSTMVEEMLLSSSSTHHHHQSSDTLSHSSFSSNSHQSSFSETDTQPHHHHHRYNNNNNNNRTPPLAVTSPVPSSPSTPRKGGSSPTTLSLTTSFTPNKSSSSSGSNIGKEDQEDLDDDTISMDDSVHTEELASSDDDDDLL